jgi:biopolymer transport protein ExbB
MRSQFLKVSALALASALFTPLTLGQEAEAEVEAPPPPTPQEVAAENLDQLLELVERGQARASAENQAREQRFSSDKANQTKALKRAEDERLREERRSARLEKKFEENELLIAAKQEQLKERLGTLSELFGHLTAASG